MAAVCTHCERHSAQRAGLCGLCLASLERERIGVDVELLELERGNRVDVRARRKLSRQAKP